MTPDKRWSPRPQGQPQPDVPLPPPPYNEQPDRSDDPRYQNLGARQVRGQVLPHQQHKQVDVGLTIASVTGLTEALLGKEDTKNRGVANGYAPLDGGAQVPTSNLPLGTGSDNVAAGNHTHTLRFSLPSFTRAGALTATAGLLRLPIDGDYTIVGVRAMVNTAPVGDDLVLDVLKNGSTIFTTTANLPTIPDGSNDNGLSAPPDINTLAAGDRLTVDVLQIGSGTAGSNLVVVVVVDKVVG